MSNCSSWARLVGSCSQNSLVMGSWINLFDYLISSSHWGMSLGCCRRVKLMASSTIIILKLNKTITTLIFRLSDDEFCTTLVAQIIKKQSRIDNNRFLRLWAFIWAIGFGLNIRNIFLYRLLKNIQTRRFHHSMFLFFKTINVVTYYIQWWSYNTHFNHYYRI